MKCLNCNNEMNIDNYEEDMSIFDDSTISRSWYYTCPKCKKQRPTNEYEKALFKKVLNKDVDSVYEAVGCEECHNGYLGRIAIHEVLVINQDIRDALSSGMPKEKLRDLVYKSDVKTLLQDGLIKVSTGLTTFEEIIKLIELDVEDVVIEKKNDTEEEKVEEQK